jgi:hypothetical protein
LIAEKKGKDLFDIRVILAGAFKHNKTIGEKSGFNHDIGLSMAFLPPETIPSVLPRIKFIVSVNAIISDGVANFLGRDIVNDKKEKREREDDDESGELVDEN